MTKLILPAPPATQIDIIELEAVYSGRVLSLPWRALKDSGQWLQGWV